jgi:hypothetical protein
MHGLIFLCGVFALITLPIAAPLDMMPPQLVPLQIPLAAIAILGTTGPVSFLVLGRSLWSTTELCASLLFRFPRLRAGAALDPLKLGALADHNLGPSGNLWMSQSSESWRTKLIRMIENAPIVILDARTMSHSTWWELSHMLLSNELPKLIVVGPVRDESLSGFLARFGGIPVITTSVLPAVIQAACGSRGALEEWYARRRVALGLALDAYRPGPQSSISPWSLECWLLQKRFEESLSSLVELHSRPMVDSELGV